MIGIKQKKNLPSMKGDIFIFGQIRQGGEREISNYNEYETDY